MRRLLFTTAAGIACAASLPSTAAASTSIVGLRFVSIAKIELNWRGDYPGASEGSNLRMFTFTKKTGGGESAQYLEFRNLGGAIVLDGLRAQAACRVVRKGGSSQVTSATSGEKVECDASKISQINGEAGENDDLICVIEPTKQPLTTVLDIHGNYGNDSITGGDAADELSGEWDDDIVRGGGGADQLFGFMFPPDFFAATPSATDDDHVYGEAGNDKIYGGPKPDTIVGGADNDFLCGSNAETELFPPRGCFDYIDPRYPVFDDYDNRIYASEPLDRDLDTDMPAASPIRKDTIDCGGGTSNSVQYDAGRDVLSRCPSANAPTASPPQLGGSYPIPAKIRRTCPPRR